MFGCEFDMLGRNIYTNIDFIKKYIIGDFYSTSYIYIYIYIYIFFNNIFFNKINVCISME
jgi:hypothetical protein